MSPVNRTLLVGISGPSTSGKTSLARLLRDIYPNSFVVHEDDFYWPDSQIPMKDGVQDWDCLESLDLEKLQSTLAYIKDNGQLPADSFSKEDQNVVQECPVDQGLIRKLKSDASEIDIGAQPIRIAIIDGFLLYAEEMKQIWELLDIRLFLRTDYQTTKQRREARSGYVTLEGFWEDPPGYVDKVVWPNYVKDHTFLFIDGDVEGSYDENVCQTMSLRRVPENARKNMDLCLSWAFDEVQGSILSRQQKSP